MKKEEFISELQLKAKSINLELSDKKAELLYEYKNLVIEWNKNINLTAITEDEEFINKHLIDSLTICKYIENKEKKKSWLCERQIVSIDDFSHDLLLPL